MPIGTHSVQQHHTRRRRSKTADSSATAADASRYLVGGVNSPVRTFRAVRQPPLHVASARGAILIDTQGRRFVDYIQGWGALILGHGHASVRQAIRAQVRDGWLFGLTTPPEISLAQAIADAFPSIEQVRFTASGTEACMTAIRLARAHTSRSKVLTFEGCYHGHSDGLLVKRGSGLATLGLARSAGVPSLIAQETLVVPYNNLAAAREAIARHGQELACVILEPIPANMGVVTPQPGFLHDLRRLTESQGILLIFDEVVTGFRVAYGGAQTLFKLRPDLTVLGKIIGGGFPVGALGGPASLMRRLSPEGDVYHAGTFAGHPVTMVAGLATLATLKTSRPYQQLERLGARLGQGLRDAARDAGISAQVNRVGSMLTVFFADQPVTQRPEVDRIDTARFAHVAGSLRERGILWPPSAFEAMFVSTAHTERLIERTIEAFRQSLAQRT